MEQITLGEVTPEYQAFVDKFKPKLTTDDCYTPPLVYEAVADWTAQTYGLDKSTFVRPFWPGGDYKRFDYPDGCVVVDNPPFSIQAEIVNWYCAKGIRFLLFTQATTSLRNYATANRCTALAAHAPVTYANGARVNTGFLTNLEQEYIIRSVPDLTAMVGAANAENLKGIRKQQPKYAYPDHVVTSATVGRYSVHGVDFGVRYGEGVLIQAMDSQRPHKKSIFGGGLLLNSKAAAEKAAAEKAAAEKANATVWELSAREWAMVREMDKREKAD